MMKFLRDLFRREPSHWETYQQALRDLSAANRALHEETLKTMRLAHEMRMERLWSDRS